MPNPSHNSINHSKSNLRIALMALVLLAFSLLTYAAVGVFVHIKSQALHAQWVSRTPVGQVVNALPASGSGWGAPATLIQTDKGYFTVHGGVALVKSDLLSLVELADHSRLLCDASHRCMAVDERLEASPKEQMQ